MTMFLQNSTVKRSGVFASPFNESPFFSCWPPSNPPENPINQWIGFHGKILTGNHRFFTLNIIWGLNRLRFSQQNQSIDIWFSYGFPMVFLWFSYGFPIKSLPKAHLNTAWIAPSCSAKHAMAASSQQSPNAPGEFGIHRIPHAVTEKNGHDFPTMWGPPR